MIQKVSFRNFKAYRSLDLELEPFTVLVGPNASGKTTILDGLGLLSEVAQGMMTEEPLYWLQPLDVRSHGLKDPVKIGVEGRWGASQGKVTAVSDVEAVSQAGRLFLPFTLSGEWRGIAFRYGKGKSNKQGRGGSIQGLLDELDGMALSESKAALSSTAVLHFEFQRLAEPSYSEEAIPEIEADGTGLASLLAYLKLSQDETFDEIEQALKRVVPTVRRIRIERAEVDKTILRTLALDETQSQIAERRTLWGQRVVLDMQGAKGVAANAAGEGTLMVLGLLTVLLGPRKPRLVLLDDIEMRLHPIAQAKLIEALRKIQQRDPGLQIVATSHSPFILNYLDPKEVRMTFSAENGFARCEKLTAHPEFERWKDMMSPGEFWSTVGESWVEKARTTADHE